MIRRYAGRRVLVVEDDFHVADALTSELEAYGLEVLGPVATVKDALALVARTDRIDGAVLDVNLRGEMVYPVADALRSKHVPFVFVTGYDASTVARHEPDVACFEKPVITTQLLEALFD